MIVPNQNRNHIYKKLNRIAKLVAIPSPSKHCFNLSRVFYEVPTFNKTLKISEMINNREMIYSPASHGHFYSEYTENVSSYAQIFHHHLEIDLREYYCL